MGEPIKVRVRDCECPTKPHNGEGDWVLLAPTLSLEGGLAAERDLRMVSDIADDNERSEALQRRWLITFVRYGAKGWNLQGPEGDLPFSSEELLDDYGLAHPVADKAADLYTEAVLNPFLLRLGARSPTGRTSVTTSARRRRTSPRRVPSSPETSVGTPQSTP